MRRCSVALVVLLVALPAAAATIQAAIDAASAGDTVLVAPGTYSGTGNTHLFMPEHDLVLRAAAGPDSTVIDGEFSRDGINYTGGVSRASRLEGFTFLHCYSPLEGGAMVALAGSSPVVADVVFRENVAGQFWSVGGAVACQSSSPLFIDVAFIGNVSDIGGGGGMYFEGGSSPDLVRVLFRENVSYGPGGALAAYYPGTVSLKDCRFESNAGDIFCEGGSLAVTNCTFSRGWAYAVHVESSTLTMVGNTIADSRHTGSLASAVMLTYTGPTLLRRNLIARNGGLAGVSWNGIGQVPGIECNDVYGNELGEYGGELNDLTGLFGNISEDPVFCGAINDPEYSYELEAGSPCLPDNNGCGVLMGAHGQGCEVVDAGEPVGPMGLRSTCHPNPFNPRTEIRFVLASDERVTLQIHDFAGRLARTLLADVPKSAGEVRIAWDGTDDSGRLLPSGVYLYRVQAGERSTQGKLMLLK